jgi:hypothetical protein
MLAAKLAQLLVSIVLTSSLRELLNKTLPTLLAGMRPFSIGDIVSMRNGATFQVLNRRGTTFRYEYKLVNIEGVNPWLLPSLPHNLDLTKKLPMFWYRGTRGSCYLKKDGHPKLKLTMSASSQSILGLSD